MSLMDICHIDIYLIYSFMNIFLYECFFMMIFLEILEMAIKLCKILRTNKSCFLMRKSVAIVSLNKLFDFAMPSLNNLTKTVTARRIKFSAIELWRSHWKNCLNKPLAWKPNLKMGYAAQTSKHFCNCVSSTPADQIALSHLKLGLLQEKPIINVWIVLKINFNFLSFVVEFIERKNVLLFTLLTTAFMQ